jgi:hypothetical protein
VKGDWKESLEILDDFGIIGVEKGLSELRGLQAKGFKKFFIL